MAVIPGTCPPPFSPTTESGKRPWSPVGTGTGSRLLDNSYPENTSLLFHFKGTVVGKLIPSLEGNKYCPMDLK